MASSTYTSSQSVSERSPEITPAERRSRHTTEVLYAVFALVVAVMFFATSF